MNIELEIPRIVAQDHVGKGYNIFLPEADRYRRDHVKLCDEVERLQKKLAESKDLRIKEMRKANQEICTLEAIIRKCPGSCRIPWGNEVDSDRAEEPARQQRKPAHDSDVAYVCVLRRWDNSWWDNSWEWQVYQIVAAGISPTKDDAHGDADAVVKSRGLKVAEFSE